MEPTTSISAGGTHCLVTSLLPPPGEARQPPPRWATITGLNGPTGRHRFQRPNAPDEEVGGVGVEQQTITAGRGPAAPATQRCTMRSRAASALNAGERPRLPSGTRRGAERRAGRRASGRHRAPDPSGPVAQVGHGGGQPDATATRSAAATTCGPGLPPRLQRWRRPARRGPPRQLRSRCREPRRLVSPLDEVIVPSDPAIPRPATSPSSATSLAASTAASNDDDMPADTVSTTTGPSRRASAMTVAYSPGDGRWWRSARRTAHQLVEGDVAVAVAVVAH